MTAHRFYELDLLRFAAAAAVVLYHFTAPDQYGFSRLAEITKFGYLGVPIFFIISGFVISMSAEGRSAYQFTVSRIARLYPGLWAGILVTVITLAWLTNQSFGVGQILANATLLNDYAGVADIDGVYWTLHAELKFYACVGLLLLFGAFRYIRIWLTVWLGLTALHTLTGQPAFMGWFISPSWSPYFIAGVALYHLHRHGPGRFNLAVLAAGSVLIAAHSVRVAGNFMHQPSPLEVSLAAVIVLAFVAFMVLVALGRAKVSGSQWVITVGALTYPLYLIHNLAGKAVIGALTPAVPVWLAVTATTGLVLLVAYGIYRWVEQPLGRSLRMTGKALPLLVMPRAAKPSPD